MVSLRKQDTMLIQEPQPNDFGVDVLLVRSLPLQCCNKDVG